jgi:short-subunit dehydrogenase
VRVWASCPNRTLSEFHARALGEQATDPHARAPWAAPTDRVVRSILRGLDSRATFHFPGWNPWLVVTAARLFPGLYDLAVARWAQRTFREEMLRGRGLPID